MRLENKVVIITGAASDIGKQTALLFAQEGANVVVADFNEKGGNEIVEEIGKTGGEAFFSKLDVSNREPSKMYFSP